MQDPVQQERGVVAWLSLALARRAAPLLLGLLWTPQLGYRDGLWLLLALSLVGVGALMLAQRISLAPSKDHMSP